MPEAAPTTEAEIIAFLGDPASYAAAPEQVERIDTHAARIFLAGSEALKIKRPVRFSYLDFSTPERRRRALERELELNRPAAPEIYRDVMPIVRAAGGGLAIGGAGTAVDWVLRMHRFDDTRLLANLAVQAPLSDALVRRLAQAVAASHRAAPQHRSLDLGAGAMAHVLDELGQELEGGESGLGEDLVRRCLSAARDRLAHTRDLLDRRALSGLVRRCHGDLHPGNIVLIGDRPVLFDALEFDERLATVDTLYDLAFLVMDLDHLGQRSAANLLLNRYLIESGDDAGIEGLAALPLFLALRAAIRAMTALQRGGMHGIEQARSYLAAATSYSTPAPAQLLAVGGYSGTGKSTLARAIAPRLGAAPGALHLRSDVERKRLLDVPEEKRLPPETYTPEMSDRVYARILDKARAALQAGHGVVLDAVYGRPGEREAVSALAKKIGVQFSGLWLTASPAILAARVTARRGDASDADAGVVALQQQWSTGANDWTEIDAGSTPAETLLRARRALGLST